MPLYEYQCQTCGELTEVIQRMSDPPLTTCETCGGELVKLLSAPAFQFKGSGWYVTDYAKSGSNGKGDSDSKGSETKSDSGSGSESKSKSESSSSSKSSKSESKTKAASASS